MSAESDPAVGKSIHDTIIFNSVMNPVDDSLSLKVYINDDGNCVNSELQWSILKQTKADTSVVVTVLIRNKENRPDDMAQSCIFEQ